MTGIELRTRIAPTPSGYLHLGNVFSFIKTWILAKHFGGRVLLRIDDLDAERIRPEYLEDIFNTLEFLGIEPDEGPSGPEDFSKNFSQHNRIGIYKDFIEQLKQSRLVYACTCSRRQIIENEPTGIYPGTCRELNRPFDLKEAALRYPLSGNPLQTIQDAITGQISEVNLTKQTGDFVVQRKNGLPAYQLASLADDVYFRVNFVVRGEDLLPSTAAQLKLAGSLGLDEFLQIKWHHHLLLFDEHGKKLSKSSGAASVRRMREQGLSKQMLLSKAGSLIFTEEIRVQNILELQEMFSASGNF